MSHLLQSLLNSVGLLPDELAGRIAVVTGAGGGIGREVARSFAALGAVVIIAEISPEGRNTEQIIQAEGGNAVFIQTDVADPISVQQMVAAAKKLFGPPDILINNAIKIAAAPVEDLDPTVWSQILAVNLTGAFLTTKAVLRDMLDRRSGLIINMVSMEAMPGLAAYIASKQGLVGFSQTLDAEVSERGVRVIAFAPGMVSTPGMRSVAGEVSSQLGLSEEQFYNFSLHPAYKGMMPVEHAGIATAYLAARLAIESHGEVVNGYEVLERAGLIERPIVEQTGAEKPEPSTKELSNPADLVDLANRFSECLAATSAEFEQLPVFIRPLARGGFKNLTGMSITDWQRSAAELQFVLQTGDREKILQFAHWFLPRTDKLIAYYQGVPGQTARFSKDQEFLREVAQRMSTRIQLVESLAEKLKTVI